MRKAYVILIIIFIILAVLVAYPYVANLGKDENIHFIGILKDDSSLKVVPFSVSLKGQVSYEDPVLVLPPAALLDLEVTSGKVYAYVDDSFSPIHISSGIYVLKKYQLPSACLPSHVFGYDGYMAYICGFKLYVFDGKNSRLLYTFRVPQPTKTIDINGASHTVNMYLNAQDIQPRILDVVHRGEYYYVYYTVQVPGQVIVGFYKLPPHISEPYSPESRSFAISYDEGDSSQYMNRTIFIFYDGQSDEWKTLDYPSSYWNVADVKELLKRTYEAQKHIMADEYFVANFFPRPADFVEVYLQKKKLCPGRYILRETSTVIPADLSVYRESPFLSSFVDTLYSYGDGPVIKTYTIGAYTIRWHMGFERKDCLLVDSPKDKNMLEIEGEKHKVKVQLPIGMLYLEPIR